jgi:hypothetical protein
MVRRRFTISPEELAAAEEYARLDNRTFSELVCEALRQHMHRYPKTRKNGPTAFEKALLDRIANLEAIVCQKYPQVPLAGNSEHVTEGIDGVPEAVRV